MSAWPRDPRVLAAAALLLAVLGLGLSFGGGGGPMVQVVVAARAVQAGQPLAPGALRLVRIHADDVAPSMLRGLEAAAYRPAGVRLAAGDYVTSSVVAAATRSVALRPGERALALRLDVSAAPARSSLPAGARVDVVVAADADARHPARSVVAASDLELIAPPRLVDGSLVVTLRAGVRQSLRLTAAQSYAHDLRLLLRSPADGRRHAGLTVTADALGGGARG